MAVQACTCGDELLVQRCLVLSIARGADSRRAGSSRCWRTHLVGECHSCSYLARTSVQGGSSGGRLAARQRERELVRAREERTGAALTEGCFVKLMCMVVCSRVHAPACARAFVCVASLSLSLSLSRPLLLHATGQNVCASSADGSRGTEPGALA